MKYVNMGGTGLIVSKLALGTMTFGSGRGRASGSAIYKVDEPGAAQLVDRALAAGVNHFNTADVYSYGESEELLGKALGARRRDAVISTKVGHRMGPGLVAAGLSRGHIIRACEDSLRRLGTDYIDVYLAHLTDPFTPLDETLEAFDHLVRRGHVRYTGFSNWPAWLAATAVARQAERGFTPFQAAEVYYSLIGRETEVEILPFARFAGIGLFVWSPLANGFLSGKYSREDPTGGGGRMTGFDQIPFDRERGYDVVDLLKRIAAKHDSSPASIALAWLVANPQVSSILIGASNERQLEQNLAAADIELDADDHAALNHVSSPDRPYPHWILEHAGDDLRAEQMPDLGDPFMIPPLEAHRRWANMGRREK